MAMRMRRMMYWRFTRYLSKQHAIPGPKPRFATFS
jgi:hypothetical protein